MTTDEQQIRQIVTDWMNATKSGDVDKILSLMTDDVVFLVPGKPPMHKAEFAKQGRAQAGKGGPEVDGKSEIQEVKVAGDWAFMWSRLEVVMTPPGGKPMTRAGHTLTVFQKQNGQWRLARDANLLAPAG
jgi:uncharacterized protein (TIGR02246 family)